MNQQHHHWRQRALDLTVTLLFAAFLFSIFFPRTMFAASPDVAAWIPYWSEEAGAKSALKHISDLDVIFPFVYEVQKDGTLVNKVDFDDDHWHDLFKKARRKEVLIIPTVMWFDGEAIEAHLSSKKYRNRHINNIVKMVDDNGFDGVNIDYEQKWAETMDDFSRFLKDLKNELEDVDDDLLLTCTIEARMEPDHRWRPADMPEEITYANDYEAMNKYCDRVELMTYDQQRADLYFNDLRKGVPYAPVADIDWVEHVLELALEDFDEDKVYLGVATYGRAWDVTVAPEWYKSYDRVAALNPSRIYELAEEIYEVPIGRTAGGEAVISYFPEDSPWKVFNALPTPKGTPKGFEAAAKALLVATYANIEIPVRVVFWSDPEAIEQKYNLAREYDLAGIAVFKVDGEEDPDMWKIF